MPTVRVCRHPYQSFLVAALASTTITLGPSTQELPTSARTYQQLTDSYELQSDDASWTIVLPLKGFVLDAELVLSNPRRRTVQAHDQLSRFRVSASIESEPQSVNSETCQNMRLAQSAEASRLEGSRLRTYRVKDQVRSEYFIESFAALPTNHHSTHVYIGRDKNCAYINISKTGFEESRDRETLNALLNRIVSKEGSLH